MLYYLFEYLDKTMDIPGAGVFQYITFRSALAFLFSLLLSTIYGKRVVGFLRKQQIGEIVRELGLEGQNEKKGTPTMGGLIIIFATLIPVFLFAKLQNIYPPAGDHRRRAFGRQIGRPRQRRFYPAPASRLLSGRARSDASDYW